MITSNDMIRTHIDFPTPKKQSAVPRYAVHYHHEATVS